MKPSERIKEIEKGILDKTHPYKKWEMNSHYTALLEYLDEQYHLNQSEKKHTRENCCYVEGCSVCQPSEKEDKNPADVLVSFQPSEKKEEPEFVGTFFGFNLYADPKMKEDKFVLDMLKRSLNGQPSEKIAKYIKEVHGEAIFDEILRKEIYPDQPSEPKSGTYVPPKGSTEDLKHQCVYWKECEHNKSAYSKGSTEDRSDVY